MKKNLLLVAALGLTVSANAQVFQYGFEMTDDAKVIQPTNWDFEDSNYDPAYKEDVIGGGQSLYAKTTGTCETYQRVVGLFGNCIQGEKSYRLTLKAKGKGSMNIGILKGCYNHDLALQAGNGDNFSDQLFNLSLPTSTKTYTYMFWCPSQADMDRKRKSISWLSEEAKGDMMVDTIWNQDFIRLSFNTEGEFLVDDIVLTESYIAGVTFNGDAIAVDFGYQTNAAKLAGETGYNLNVDCVSVTQDEEELSIGAAELHDDGKLYIYLEDEIDEADGEVKVSFKNDGTLTYSTTTAPFSFTTLNAPVCDFEEVAVYDEDLDEESVIYSEAVLLSTTPVNNAFEVDVNTQEFSFTFSKEVLIESTIFGAPEATLDGAGINNEKLELVSTENGTTLTFKRTGTTPMSKGSYTLSIKNVRNSMNRESSEAVTPATTFEAGDIKIGKSEYTLVYDGTFPDAVENNGAPANWTVVTDSELRYDTTAYGSGGRVFAFTNSSVQKACYFRTSNKSQEGYVSSPKFTLPAADIELRAFIAAWKNSVKLRLEIFKADSTSVHAEEVTSTVNLNGEKNGKEFQTAKIRFTPEAGDYYFRVSVAEPGDGMIEAMCGGIQAYTYVEEEGDKPQNTVYFTDDFSHTENDKVMVATSGWIMYDASCGFDTKPWCKPGEGRSSSGGVLNRNSFSGLYLRCATPANQYALYGADIPEALNGLIETIPLELPAGILTLSYDVTGWDSSLPKTWFEIFPYEAGRDYGSTEATDYIVRKEVECQSYLTNDHTPDPVDKVMMDIKIPAAGRYVIKLTCNGSGTYGQAVFDNINLMKMGSKGVQYKIDLYDLIAKADEELSTAKADANNVGSTQDNLESLITYYKSNTLHTIAEYDLATKELEAAIKAMKARRANVSDYNQGTMAALKELVENTKGSKFEVIDQYSFAEATIARFDGKLCTDLDDEELATAVNDIKLAHDALDYMIKTGVGVLTKQIQELAKLLIKFSPAAEESDLIIAADEAVSDNQNLARALKVQVAKALCDTIVKGYNFSVFNSDTETSDEETIDLTSFVPNGYFYCTSLSRQNTPATSWPHWTVEATAGVMPSYGWDGWTEDTKARPVANSRICMGWVGNAGFTASNTVDVLPAGTYSITAGFGNSGVADRITNNEAEMFNETNYAYLYVTCGEKVDTLAATTFDGHNVVKQEMGEIQVTVPEGEKYATIGLKAAVNVTAGFCSFGGGVNTTDNFHLIMTAKDPNFNYAKLSKDLEEEISGIQVATRDDAPVSVVYYNLNGVQTVAPSGISIQVETYSDGYTVVKKINRK